MVRLLPNMVFVQYIDYSSNQLIDNMIMVSCIRFGKKTYYKDIFTL